MLDPNEKHFKKVVIDSTDKWLILNDLSFGNITFDEFEGYMIKQISNNAFGYASSTIQNFTLYNSLNHDPPNHDIWNVLSRLTNAKFIRGLINIIEIPSDALKNLSNLKELMIQTLSKTTIRRKAFYNLNNLLILDLKIKEIDVEEEAFAFQTRANPTLGLHFYENIHYRFDEKAFDGLQGNVDVAFSNMSVDAIVELPFKSVLDNKENRITLLSSKINCTNCLNHWMIKYGKDNQVKDATCSHNSRLTLFSSEIKSNLRSKCSAAFGIRYSNVLLLCLFVFIKYLF